MVYAHCKLIRGFAQATTNEGKRTSSHDQYDFWLLFFTSSLGLKPHKRSKLVKRKVGGRKAVGVQNKTEKNDFHHEPCIFTKFTALFVCTLVVSIFIFQLNIIFPFLMFLFFFSSSSLLVCFLASPALRN